MHLLPCAAALMLIAAISLFSAGAQASPSYPAAVASALELPCNPECTLCHTRATGGFATVNTPFGRGARMQASLMCCEPAALPDVLEALREAELDSDDDGTPDLEELEALTDPNDPADVDLACTPPSSRSDGGCSVASVRPRRGGPRLLVLAVIAVVVAAVVVVTAVARRRLA